MLVHSLELLLNTEFARKKSSWYYLHSHICRVSIILNDLNLRDLSLESLENVRLDEKWKLINVLSCCPPDSLEEEYGLDAVLFAATGRDTTDEDILMHLAYRYGVKKDQVKQAITHRNLRDGLGNITVPLLDKTLKLIASCHSLTGFNLENELTPFTNDNVVLSESRKKSYSLSGLSHSGSQAEGYETVWGFKEDDEKRYVVYVDASAAFGLLYQGVLQAVCAMSVDNLEIIKIVQLQGVCPILNYSTSKKKIGHSRGLAVLKWQELLVHVASQLSGQLGFPKIAIEGAINNKWTNVLYNDGKVHLPLERAIRNYDLVAERLGYSKASNGNWYASIPVNRE